MSNLILFLVGVLEMWVASAFTESVAQRKVVKSGIITFVNITIWYFVIRVVIDDIQNIWVLILYATGCSVGTMAKVLYTRRKK